jgi:hypothetical protein
LGFLQTQPCGYALYSFKVFLACFASFARAAFELISPPPQIF